MHKCVPVAELPWALPPMRLSLSSSSPRTTARLCIRHCVIMADHVHRSGILSHKQSAFFLADTVINF